MSIRNTARFLSGPSRDTTPVCSSAASARRSFVVAATPAEVINLQRAGQFLSSELNAKWVRYSKHSACFHQLKAEALLSLVLLGVRLGGAGVTWDHSFHVSVGPLVCFWREGRLSGTERRVNRAN